MNAEESAEPNTAYEEQPMMRMSDEEYYGIDQLNYLKTLIETSDLPDYGKKLFFGVFDRNVVLTRFDDRDVYIFMNRVDAICARVVAYMPREHYTADMELFLKNIKNLAHAVVRRSYKGFERERQIARYNYIQRPDEVQQHQGGGIWSKLIGGWR